MDDGVRLQLGVERADGNVMDQGTYIIGKDGKVLEVLKDVSPESHGHDLAERLKALNVAKRGT